MLHKFVRPWALPGDPVPASADRPERCETLLVRFRQPVQGNHSGSPRTSVPAMAWAEETAITPNVHWRGFVNRLVEARPNIRGRIRPGRRSGTRWRRGRLSHHGIQHLVQELGQA